MVHGRMAGPGATQRHRFAQQAWGEDMGEARRRKLAGADPSAPDKGANGWLERGRLRQLQGDPQAALALYARALSRNPRDVDALRLSASALVELGALPPASQRLRQALALCPDDAELHYQLGRVLLQMAQVQTALECFAQALRCEPRHGPALYLRAATLESLGDVGAAAAGFVAAAAAEPSRALAHLGAARQLYLLDRVAEAMAYQRQAIALDADMRRDGVIGCARAQPLPEPLSERRQRSAALCSAAPGSALEHETGARELLVLDDFLPDPLARRAHALSLAYTEASGHLYGNFPGSQTAGGHADQATMQRIANLLERDIKWGWPSHGAFRLSPATATACSDIHADLDQSRPAYAGVLYLSLPEDCQGGTSFWRHRETGWSKVPDEGQARASRFGSYAEFMRRRTADAAQAFEQLSAARDEWELVFEVPMRFNRLILYRSDFFHGISTLFGHKPGDSRLVQLYFFEPMHGADAPQSPTGSLGCAGDAL